MITLTTVYVEGERRTRRYTTLEGARKAAAKRFGKSPERGSRYVHDDYAVLYVDGASFDDLFPDSEDARETARENAKLPNVLKPYEVWSCVIDDYGPDHRKFKDGAFATLDEANQFAEQLDEHADGVCLVGVTEHAKAEIAKQAEAYREQMDREINEDF